MSHSIKNPATFSDVAPGAGFGEIQEAPRSPAATWMAERTGLAYHVLKAGKRQGFAHRHHDAEEIYVVLSGTGRIKLDDEIQDVGPMDAIRIAPLAWPGAFEAGARRAAGDPGLRSPPRQGRRADRGPGFWATEASAR